MSTITSSISAITAPNKATEVDASSPASISAFVDSQELYSAQVSDNLVSEINTVTGEINIVKDEMVIHEANVSDDKDIVVAKEALMSPHYDAIDNIDANMGVIQSVDANMTDINNAESNANIASTSAAIATAGANYQGNWVAGFNTTGYSIGMAVSYSDGFNYQSKVNTNLTEPTSETNTAEWNFVEAISPAMFDTKSDKSSFVTTTTNVTASHLDYVLADTLTTGALTVTLPATPSVGDYVDILDVKGNFSTANLTVARNGENIMGLAEDMVVDTDNISLRLMYVDGNWRLV